MPPHHSHAVRVLTSILALGCLLACGDADRDAVEAFAEGLEGEVSQAKLDQALRYADPDRAMLEIDARGIERTYGEGESADLRADARVALRGYLGVRLRPLSRQVEVEGARATVATRLLSEQGMVDLQVTLTKVGDDWLVSRLRVR